MYNSGAFSIFTRLFTYHYLSLEHFGYPKRSPIPIRSYFSFPSSLTRSPKQPLIHFLYGFVYSGIIKYVFFCIWLYLLLIDSVVLDFETNKCKYLLEHSVFFPLKLLKSETGFGFEKAVIIHYLLPAEVKNKSSLNEMRVCQSPNLKSKRNLYFP